MRDNLALSFRQFIGRIWDMEKAEIKSVAVYLKDALRVGLSWSKYPGCLTKLCHIIEQLENATFKTKNERFK